ncbi:MAG: hypothetical protein MZV65_32410 [Chromatiales bacterium]|nr:hypothetical protein [Chromatiales bacterium]
MSVANPAAVRAARQRPILLVRTGQRARFLGIGGDLAIAVDVGGEGDVAQFGQLCGAALGVVVQPHPCVNDQDAGQWTFRVLGISEIPHQPGIALPVFDGLGFDGGLAQSG